MPRWQRAQRCTENRLWGPRREGLWGQMVGYLPHIPHIPVLLLQAPGVAAATGAGGGGTLLKMDSLDLTERISREGTRF